jgi:hypothetical protein
MYDGDDLEGGREEKRKCQGHELLAYTDESSSNELIVSKKKSLVLSPETYSL